MLDTAANLAFWFAQFDTRFQDAYRGEQVLYYPRLSTTIPSSTEFNSYGWQTRTRKMRQWDSGERQSGSVSTYEKHVTNKTFEDTISLSRTKILDDRLELFSFSLEALAQAAKRWPDQLMFDSTGPLRNGQNLANADGTTFFSTTHPIDTSVGQVAAANQSNYTASGGALTIDNYQAARAAMMNYVLEDGLPAGVVPDLLVVPPALEVTARLICEATSIAPQLMGGNTQVGANTNVLAGTAEVLVVPYLAADTTTWYLLDTGKRGGRGGSPRPFIFQERQPPNLVTLTDPSNTHVFKYNEYLYGVDARGAVDFSHWWLAYKSVA
jgi:phage major head subunit gpT-like protein